MEPSTFQDLPFQSKIFLTYPGSELQLTYNYLQVKQSNGSVTLLDGLDQLTAVAVPRIDRGTYRRRCHLAAAARDLGSSLKGGKDKFLGDLDDREEGAARFHSLSVLTLGI